MFSIISYRDHTAFKYATAATLERVRFLGWYCFGDNGNRGRIDGERCKGMVRKVSLFDNFFFIIIISRWYITRLNVSKSPSLQHTKCVFRVILRACHE